MRRLVLPIAVLVALSGCKEQKAEAPPPVRPVLTTTVALEEARTFGPFAGTVQPRYESQLGFRIGGRIVARDVFVGDQVAKGTRLAALDPTVQQFALVRARADVADAQAQVKNASAAEGRQRILFENNSAVTQAQLDGAVANRDTADARLAQAKAALQKATDELGYATLTAGFDGVVTAWSAEVGQVVPPGQVVVTMARPDVREAVVDIPDDLIGELPKDIEFTVRLQEVPEVTARARVREIGPLAEASTRTRRVRMSLIDPPDGFRLGNTVTVAFERPVSRASRAVDGPRRGRRPRRGLGRRPGRQDHQPPRGHDPGTRGGSRLRRDRSQGRREGRRRRRPRLHRGPGVRLPETGL